MMPLRPAWSGSVGNVLNIGIDTYNMDIVLWPIFTIFLPEFASIYELYPDPIASGN